MNSTGKAARKRYGTRAAAKRAKGRKRTRKQFGKLPVSNSKGNASSWVIARSGEAPAPEVSE